MRWPLNPPVHVTKEYSTAHPALDLGAATGTPIFAPESGKVILVNNNASSYYGGMYVVIMSNTGYRHYMGHNSKNLVSIGEVVSEGQHIANIGMTGFAVPSQGISAPTGPHTHWEVKKNGVTVDASKLVTQVTQGGDVSTVGEVEFNDLFRAFIGSIEATPTGTLAADRKRWIGKETNTVIREMEADPRHPLIVEPKIVSSDQARLMALDYAIEIAGDDPFLLRAVGSLERVYRASLSPIVRNNAKAANDKITELQKQLETSGSNFIPVTDQLFRKV